MLQLEKKKSAYLLTIMFAEISGARSLRQAARPFTLRPHLTGDQSHWRRGCPRLGCTHSPPPPPPPLKVDYKNESTIRQ